MDYTFLINNQKYLNEFVTFGESINLLKPDIFAINDDVSKQMISYCKNLCAKHGISFVLMKRNTHPLLEKISTTEISNKLK